MKFLLFVSFAYCIIACVHFATATPRAKPLVGDKIKQTCTQSLGHPKVLRKLCLAAADHIAEEVVKTCHRAIKDGCNQVSYVISKKKCNKEMKKALCPIHRPDTVVIEQKPDLKGTDLAHGNGPKDDTDRASWIGRLVISKCEKELIPKLTHVTTGFCDQLSNTGKDVCTKALVKQCDYLPNSIAIARPVCKNYVVDWICS